MLISMVIIKKAVAEQWRQVVSVPIYFDVKMAHSRPNRSKLNKKIKHHKLRQTTTKKKLKTYTLKLIKLKKFILVII